MKRTFVIIPLSLFLMTLAVTGLRAQAKFDKALKKAETAYEAGDYKNALSALEKFKKKTFGKLGNQNPYTATYYMLLAKYSLAAGMVADIEPNVQASLTAAAAIHSENSQKYGQLLMDAAALYLQNGSYKTVREYLAKAKKTLEGGKFMTPPLQARWNVITAEALSGQGFYNEALESLWRAKIFYGTHTAKQESFVDDKGNLKSRKLTDEEILQRSNDYANVLTLIGTTYGQQGNLRNADDTLALASQWIKKNLGQTSLAYIRNQFYNASILEENGNVELPKDLAYSNLLDLLKADHHASHALGIEIYGQYLKQLLRDDNTSRYLNTKLEFEKLVKANFKKGSIYYVLSQTAELDSKLSNDKTKNLERDANLLITSSSVIPHNSLTTVVVLRFLYDLAVREKEYVNAEKYLNEIVDIKTNLDGDEAPEVHLARVQLANFYLDYTNKIPEAGKIYDDSFTKVVEKEIGPWHKDYLNILNHMADYYELTDNYPQATVTLDKASDIARSKYDNKDYQYGIELNNIARLQIKLGLYEKAEDNLNKSLAILEEFRKDEAKKRYLINAIETQAVLFGIKGLFDDAETTWTGRRKSFQRPMTMRESTTSVPRKNSPVCSFSSANMPTRRTCWIT